MFGSLRKKLEEYSAQVNPLDGGKTAQTVRASRNPVQPAQTRSGGLSVGVARPQQNVNVAQPKPTPAIRVGNTRVMQSPTMTNRSEIYQPQTNLNKTLNTGKDFLQGTVNQVNRATTQVYESPVGRVLGPSRSQLIEATARRNPQAGDVIRQTGYDQLLKDSGITKTDTAGDIFRKSFSDIAGTTANFVPVSRGVNLARGGVAKEGLVKYANKSGLIGATGAGVSSLREPSSVQEIATNTAMGYGLGAGLPLAGAGLNRAVIKPTSNLVRNASPLNESGFIQFGATPKKIHPEDQNIMADFIDMQRGVYRPDPDTAYRLELDASRLAERYGIVPGANKKIEPTIRLANAFDKRLQTDRFKGVEPTTKLVSTLTAPFKDEVGAVGRNIRPQAGKTRPPQFPKMADDAVERVFDSNLMRPQIPAVDVPSPVPKIPRSQLTSKSLGMTDKQLQNTALSQIQNKSVKEYSEFLKSIDDEMTGGELIPDGNGGYKRTSSHSKFYRDYFLNNGRKPSKLAWEEHAKEQLESGRAMDEFQKMYNQSKDPEFMSLLAKAETPVNELELNKRSAKTLSQEVKSFRSTLTPVKQSNTESIVPVSKILKDGDTLTKTNVNPNIQKGEKRYSVDSDGNLIEDRKGAYRIFTDNDGKIQNIRIGNKVFDSNDYGDLSDVNGYASSLATMRRNVERGFGKKTSDKLSKFLLDHQQQAATKMIERNLAIKQGMKNITKDLGINFSGNTRKAKKVSAAIQDFGEGQINKSDLVSQFGQKQADKIVQADKWFRGQYDTLLDEMNNVLTQYGYDPVPKRKDYYTHFQDEKIWKTFGLKMQEIAKEFGSPTMQDANPSGARGKISNQLAGQSEYMTPNKQFNPFALQRKGETRTADAFQAFERYLNPTLSNIYMTPSITRARVIARGIADSADLEGKDANKIIVQLREWANHLSGKSNRLGDRQLSDTMAGPAVLKGLNLVQKMAGQNTIVGNLSTAVLQPVVLAQTAGKFGYKNVLLGALQTASPKSRSIMNQSQFLKRRYADNSLITQGKIGKAREVANTPLYVVEKTAAEITWNSAYNDAVSKGLKGQKAIQYADINTEKTLAGRSIGERPEVFRSKTAGPATMFQLEVNNFWQQMGKEMTKGQATKTLLALYAFNLGLQELTGRQVGFNPIDAAIDSYEDFKKEDKPLVEKIKQTGQRFAGEVVDNTPFVAPIANFAIGDRKLRNILGNTSNVGRFGVSSPIGALTTTTDVGLPVNLPLNAMLPFGGAQIKKTIEGVKASMDGKVTDKDDKTLVDVPQNLENLVRGATFGKNSIPEVNKYYQNIGKKKYDQVEVPNQVDSKAKNMGVDTPQSNTEIFESAFNSPEGQEYLALDTTARKKHPLHNQYLAMERAFTEPDLTEDLSDEAKKVLRSHAKLTDETRKQKEYSETDYEYKLKKAEYEKDKPGLTKKESLDRERQLRELELKSTYSKEARDVYSMSEDNILEYIDTYKPADDFIKELFALDQLEVDNGLRKKLKLTSVGSSKSSGKRSAGRSSKFKYKIAGFGNDPVSTTKSLRALLEKAVVS